MGFKSDIEIAQECTMEPITKIAEKAGIDDKYLEQYGKYKAKIDYNLLKETDKKDGKLILVTAINPTPAGEGKTTTTVGLADGMQRLGKNVMVALREPSLGPVFGVKGGAAGGGYAQVVPMEDINLHFTGDFHAIGAANNLLAAMIDNHIFQGNALNIDPRKITWKRCVDMNDRQLRNVVDGLGGKTNGMPREDGYDITVASEIMAILCLANDMADLKEEQKIVLEFLNTVSAGKDKLSIKDITEYCKNNRENVQKIDLKFSKAVREQEINMENYDEKAEKEYKKHCVFAIGGFCMNIGLIALLTISESLSVIGVTMLTIAISLVNSILELALANRKYTFTQKGTDEREKWRAFKKYMEDFSLLKDKEIPALIVWEKYLVYATAFKISSKVLKQLKIVYPEIMDMNPNIDTNNYIHMMNTLDLGSYMNTAISSVYSSGNGSGGGFSGGGGGGRRRWRRRRTLNLK